MIINSYKIALQFLNQIKNSLYGLFAKKENIPSNKNSKNKTIDIIKSILFACLITFCFRSFVFDPYRIPTGSMEPNFIPGDRIIISKYRYGYSGSSFFPIAFHSKKRFLQFRYPKRGDVIVFLKSVAGQNGKTSKTFFVKRVIGIPGDTIEFGPENKIYVNNEPFESCQASDLQDTSYFYETSTDGISYIKIDKNYKKNSQYFIYKDDKMMSKIEIPEGRYFVMGDNRSNSADSRFLDYMGLVGNEEIAGRVEYIMFSSTSPGVLSGLNPFNIRFRRLLRISRYNKIDFCQQLLSQNSYNQPNIINTNV